MILFIKYYWDIKFLSLGLNSYYLLVKQFHIQYWFSIKWYVQLFSEVRSFTLQYKLYINILSNPFLWHSWISYFFNRSFCQTVDINSGTQLIIYAYDQNLSEYFAAANLSFKPNTYRPPFTNVQNGYGCFWSLNLLVKNLK